MARQHARRGRRPVLILALAALAIGAGRAGGAEPPQDDAAAEALQVVLGPHPGPAALEGLCVLPETHAAFVRAVPTAGQPPACSALAQLTAGQREAAVQSAVQSVQRFDAPAQRRFLARLGGWITAVQQFAIAERLSSAEEVMAAAFAVPRTRPLFDAILANRGRSAAAVSPLELGATLAAEEHTQLRRRIATVLSRLSPPRQLAYYRDLLGALVSLQHKERAG